jgi:hypothetical protein
MNIIQTLFTALALCIPCIVNAQLGDTSVHRNQPEVIRQDSTHHVDSNYASPDLVTWVSYGVSINPNFIQYDVLGLSYPIFRSFRIGADYGLGFKIDPSDNLTSLYTIHLLIGDLMQFGKYYFEGALGGGLCDLKRFSRSSSGLDIEINVCGFYRFKESFGGGVFYTANPSPIFHSWTSGAAFIFTF